MRLTSQPSPPPSRPTERTFPLPTTRSPIPLSNRDNQFSKGQWDHKRPDSANSKSSAETRINDLVEAGSAQWAENSESKMDIDEDVVKGAVKFENLPIKLDDIPCSLPSGSVKESLKVTSSQEEMKTNIDIVIPSGKILGKIKNFLSHRKFGYITPDNKSDIEVYVNVKNFVGYLGNEWPILPAGYPVEFLLKKGKKGWYAEHVCKPGGAPIVNTGEDPEKNYNRNVFYKGIVRYFDFKKGFGFIVFDDEYIEWAGLRTGPKVDYPIIFGKTDTKLRSDRPDGDIFFPGPEIVSEKRRRLKGIIRPGTE